MATSTPPNGAFRGFGAPQTIWAIERHMDRVATRLGLDPLEYKRRCSVAVGSTTVTGQTLTESVGLAECIERLSQLAVELEEVEELDINPVMVYPAPAGVLVADARVLLSPGSKPKRA